ncbi:hypothetical protein PoB_001504000 [Plakobranchus ocellatus]|uniref:Uncharacterized protein n=1 Tax=Plakobranchus ocellatus TaxID=259542 RepID=A0AAV3YZD5_9GAST|nr:hypothetical protein PoB_001504000 [Plakobranchus ocellatus]
MPCEGHSGDRSQYCFSAHKVDTLSGTPALCQGYPGVILLAESVGSLLGLTQALFKEKDQPRGKFLEREKWPRVCVDERQPLLPAVTTSTPRIQLFPCKGRTLLQTRHPHCVDGLLSYIQHLRATVERIREQKHTGG